MFLNIIDNIPFMYTRKNNTGVVKSLFNEDLLTYLYVFFIYSIFNDMITILDRQTEHGVELDLSDEIAAEISRSETSLLLSLIHI